MTFRGFIGRVLLLGTLYTSGFSEELEFTGSFWDTADSFRLTIDMGNDRAHLKWDGYPDNDYDREKKAAGRFTLNFELNEGETKLLRKLYEGVPLAHSGHRVMRGTGLSNTVTCREAGEIKHEHHYFHPTPNAALGKRMSEIPLSFQAFADDRKVNQTERDAWMSEIQELAADLLVWRKALQLLTNAHKQNQQVPWKELFRLSHETVHPQKRNSSPERNAFAYEASQIVDALISIENRTEYFPKLGANKVIIRIDEITRSDENWWQATAPPHDLCASSDLWRLAPPPYFRLIEDFINGEGARIGGLHYHGMFDLTERQNGGLDEYQARLSFIESSVWSSPFVDSESETSQLPTLRILSLAFEKNLSECAVISDQNGETLLTILKVKDGEWKIQRQIEYDMLPIPQLK